jgi:hypothetical protein
VFSKRQRRRPDCLPQSARTGGGGAPRSGVTEGAALSEAERGTAEMSTKFAEVGKELYVSESGENNEAIDLTTDVPGFVAGQP